LIVQAAQLTEAEVLQGSFIKMPSLVRTEGSVLAGISSKGRHKESESMRKWITFNGQIGELISFKYYVIGQCHLSLICNNRFV